MLSPVAFRPNFPQFTAQRCMRQQPQFGSLEKLQGMFDKEDQRLNQEAWQEHQDFLTQTCFENEELGTITNLDVLRLAAERMEKNKNRAIYTSHVSQQPVPLAAQDAVAQTIPALLEKGLIQTVTGYDSPNVIKMTETGNRVIKGAADDPMQGLDIHA